MDGPSTADAAARRSAAPSGDALALILALLPADSLAAAELVCRSWRRAAAPLWQRHARAAAAGDAGGGGDAGGDAGGGAASAPAAGTWKRDYLEARWARAFAAEPRLSAAAGPGVSRVEAHAGAAVTAVSSLRGLVATASDDGSVRLWAAPPAGGAPRALATLRHGAPVIYVKLLSPALVVSATTAEGLVWRADGALVRRVAPPGGAAAGVCAAAAWDGWLALATPRGDVAVHDAYSGRLDRLLPRAGGAVAALAHARHAGRDYLVAAGNRAVRVYAFDGALALAEGAASFARRGMPQLAPPLCHRAVCFLHVDAAAGLLHCTDVVGGERERGASGRPAVPERLVPVGGASLAALRLCHHTWSLGPGLSALPDPAELALAGQPPRALRRQAPALTHVAALEQTRSHCVVLSRGHLYVASKKRSSIVGLGEEATPPADSHATCIDTANRPVAVGLADGTLLLWHWSGAGVAPQ